MICFEVCINGKKVCLAGVGEIGVLAAHLTWVVRERNEADEDCEEGDTHVEELFVNVGGLIQHGKDSMYLDWINEDLEMGDEVTFRIVERETCDTPEKARTEIAEVVERKRREYYEQMKKEYEDDKGKEGP